MYIYYYFHENLIIPNKTFGYDIETWIKYDVRNNMIEKFCIIKL